MKLSVSIFLYFVILFSLKAQNDSIYLVSTNKTLTKYRTTDVDSIVFYSNPVTREYNDTMYVHLKNKLVTILPVDLFDTAFYRPVQNPSQYNSLYFTVRSCVGYTMANVNYVIQSTNNITASGVCYSTNPYPTVNDLKVASTSGNGSKNVTITNLQTDKIYYARVYYNTGSQVVYSEQVKLRTKPRGISSVQNTYYIPQYSGMTSDFKSLSNRIMFESSIIENGNTGNTYQFELSSGINNPPVLPISTRELSCSTGNEVVTLKSSFVEHSSLLGANRVTPIINTIDNQRIQGLPYTISWLSGLSSNTFTNIVVECKNSNSIYITFNCFNSSALSSNGFIISNSPANPILVPLSTATLINPMTSRYGILVNSINTNSFYNLYVYGRLSFNDLYILSHTISAFSTSILPTCP
ncbi:MAG: hypothetical protein MUE33_12545 [Cytophagaceae bacterium]|jgi:hypothetical protein|nr:hypothetical protein [Cytophagaceae bacterium]